MLPLLLSATIEGRHLASRRACQSRFQVPGKSNEQEKETQIAKDVAKSGSGLCICHATFERSKKKCDKALVGVEDFSSPFWTAFGYRPPQLGKSYVSYTDV